MPDQFTPIDETDEARVRVYRLDRTRQLLAQFKMDAVVLFDLLNLRYATGCRNMQVWTSHHLRLEGLSFSTVGRNSEAYCAV